MTEQQYLWQCPICPTQINFGPEPLPESLTREIVEEVRKLNANSYLMILAERSQHMFNHALKGEGIGMLGKIKKELEKEEEVVDLHGGPGPLMWETEEEEEKPKEDLDDNTEQSSVDTSQGPGDDTEENLESD